MFNLESQRQEINSTLEIIYSKKQNSFNLLENNQPINKIYSTKKPFSQKSLEEQWAEIIRWFFEESEVRSQDLLHQLKQHLASNQTKNPIQLQSAHLQKWINGLEQLAEHRYHLGSSLNRFYHFNNFSFGHRVDIITCLREFIEIYSKNLEVQR